MDYSHQAVVAYYDGGGRFTMMATARFLPPTLAARIAGGDSERW